MERVAKQGIICSLISHLEANSFLQLVSGKCSSVIGTGSRASGTRGSVPFLPELAEQLTSLCIRWPRFTFPLLGMRILLFRLGQVDLKSPVSCFVTRAPVDGSDKFAWKADVQEMGVCTSRDSQSGVPGLAALPSPESWSEVPVHSPLPQPSESETGWGPVPVGQQTFSVSLMHRKVGDMLTAPGDAAQFSRAGFTEHLLLSCSANGP